jgi:hypothetical protein
MLVVTSPNVQQELDLPSMGQLEALLNLIELGGAKLDWCLNVPLLSDSVFVMLQEKCYKKKQCSRHYTCL